MTAWRLLVAIAALASQPLASAGETGGYTLVWADEFEGDMRPDPDNWTFETGFVRNREAQWYQPENAFLEDGKLVIEARREHRPHPGFGDPSTRSEFRDRQTIDFTSASLTTKGLHAWQYGRFEVRARIKAEEGLWPAIWTLGVAGRWPAKGEIDIMEYYGGNVLANFAWAADHPRRPTWKSRRVALEELTTDENWDERFHVWRMDWTEEEITLWLDGRLMNRIDLNRVKNHPRAGVGHPFRQPHYLILNLALGGDNGGSLARTGFPSRYEIDYVRVYQRKGGGE